MDFITPETMNTIWIVLAVAVGWIVLRFILRLARRIFAFGCFAIVVLGAMLLIWQYLGGV
jgi:hypothetical protein